MNNKEIRDLFKAAYEFEHQRKDAFNSRLSFPLTVMILIIGAASYFLDKTHLSNLNWIRIAFLGTLLVVMLAIIRAFYSCTNVFLPIHTAMSQILC